MYIKIDEDTVVALNGDEYRRSGTEQWREYEKFVASGGVPQERFTEEQWSNLNDLSRMRLEIVRP